MGGRGIVPLGAHCPGHTEPGKPKGSAMPETATQSRAERTREHLRGMTEEQRREAFIRGLRELAEFFETHPDAPLYVGSWCAEVTVDEYIDAKTLKAAARQIGRAEKDVDSTYFNLTKEFGKGTVKYALNAPRGDVCERRVIGKHTKVVKKKDPKAIEAVPEIEVEEEVEEIEWICPDSLLGTTQEGS